jgi:hypothetical protein
MLVIPAAGLGDMEKNDVLLEREKGSAMPESVMSMALFGFCSALVLLSL